MSTYYVPRTVLDAGADSGKSDTVSAQMEVKTLSRWSRTQSQDAGCCEDAC